MLILYEIKAMVISFALAVYGITTVWRRQPAETGLSVGYGEADVTDTDK